MRTMRQIINLISENNEFNEFQHELGGGQPDDATTKELVEYIKTHIRYILEYQEDYDAVLAEIHEHLVDYDNGKYEKQSDGTTQISSIDPLIKARQYLLNAKQP